MLTASHIANMPGIAEFVAANPNASPGEMLQVVLAETERLKEDNQRIQEERAIREHEYKVATEVELDEHLQARPKTLGQLLRFAKVLVDGGLVPDNYLKVKTKNGEGNPVAAVAGAIMFANRCNVDIFVFLQSSYPLNGKIALEAKLVNSLLISSGKIVGRPKYTKEYDDAGNVTKCTCTVIDKETGDEKTKEVNWDMVVANGWHLDRQSQKSKWVTLRDTMFEYRSSTLLSRVHYPDVLYGSHTIDEIEDIGGTPSASEHAPTGNGAAAASLTELSQRLGAAPKAKPKKESKPSDSAETSEVENDPFPPSPAPAETAAKPEEKKTTTKPTSRATNEKSPAVNGGAQSETRQSAGSGGTAAASGKSAFNPDRYRGYISMTFESDLGDFDVEKIIGACAGHADPTAIIDSIFKRKHPDFESYLVEKLRPKQPENHSQTGPENDSQESETAGSDVDQDVPDFIREPLPRPKKLCLMATDCEKTIIGKRSFEQIRQYLKTDVKANPHLEQAEEAYLLDLGKRRAYQLEHSITPTDKMPK
jgi:hypothetical protein